MYFNVNADLLCKMKGLEVFIWGPFCKMKFSSDTSPGDIIFQQQINKKASINIIWPATV